MQALRVSLIILFATLTASAAISNEAYLAMANDIDGLLSDTVNEGEGSAHVRREGNVPEMKCTERESRKEPGKTWYFCTVDFDVTVTSESDSEVRACSLSWSVLNSDLSTLERGRDQDFDSCIENLGSGD